MGEGGGALILHCKSPTKARGEGVGVVGSLGEGWGDEEILRKPPPTPPGLEILTL